MLKRMHAIKTRPFYFEVNIRVGTNAHQPLRKKIFHTLPPTEKDDLKKLFSTPAFAYLKNNNNNLTVKASNTHHY